MVLRKMAGAGGVLRFVKKGKTSSYKSESYNRRVGFLFVF